ncbi:MarR family winged helix-turn-helix transcriptional regulator [Parvularcula dongshanensis]|uniref:DNA-binding MarR family transcriptional regulator n=1 Tax=Parvularcula dongshanensis TaxID=1173995 RepID=A0A840I1C6_9PROT|nr:MarR family winged helix-turn-helix transcriptional regulator [Parvularcula dongshanensis]MBB4657880.1 DNA-binding MarR family transcriptional regulator [Parvularcula dongshanensis]
MTETVQRARESELVLSEFVPFRLSVLSNTVSEGIAAQYRERFGLTIPQWRVIAVLGQSPDLAAKAIAARTAMDKVAVSRAVAGLLEAGRIERRVSPADGRSSRLSLTEAGRAIYDEVAVIARSYEAELLSVLSGKEREVLNRMLDRLAKQASPSGLW